MPLKPPEAPVGTLSTFSDIDTRLDALESRNVKTPIGIYTGAAGNGSTDDTLVIQAHQAALGTAGGVLYFPMGQYNHTTTSAPLISVGAGAPIVLLGDITGTVSTGQWGSRLKRTTGTNPIVKYLGTGSSSGEVRAHGGMLYLELHGGGTSGTVCHLERCNEMTIERTRFGNATGSGLICRQVWNTTFGKIDIYACGTGTGTPALLIDGIASDSASDTLIFESPRFELNTGTDIQIGATADTNSANKIKLIGPKFERGGAGQANGTNMTWPVIDFQNTTNCTVIGGDATLITPAAGTNSSKIFIGGSAAANSLGLISIIGFQMTSDGTATEYGVISGGNKWALVGVHAFISGGSGPTNKFLKIDSAMPTTGVRIVGYMPSSGAKAIDDQRTGIQALRGNIRVPIEKLSAGATATEFAGGVSGYSLADAVFGTVQGNVLIPDDANPNRPILLRATWATALTAGNVRLQCEAASLGTIGDASVTLTAAVTTQAVSSTANRRTQSDFIPSGININPGDVLAVRFFRNGGDAADTAVGAITLISLDLLYEQIA